MTPRAPSNLLQLYLMPGASLRSVALELHRAPYIIEREILAEVGPKRLRQIKSEKKRWASLQYTGPRGGALKRSPYTPNHEVRWEPNPAEIERIRDAERARLPAFPQHKSSALVAGEPEPLDPREFAHHLARQWKEEGVWA